MVAPTARHNAAKILLMSLPPEAAKPAQLPKPKLRAFQVPKLPKRAQPVHSPALLEAPVLQTVVTPPAARPAPMIPTPAPAPQPAPPQVKTGLLDAPQIATAPASRPAPSVQSAGFAQVLPNEANPKAALTIRSAGFDQGPNSAAQNEPKRMASVGAFGGPATTAGTAGTPRRAISDGGFGDTVLAAPQQGTPRVSTPQASDSNPIEITFKPRPAYTEEARRRQIQGEVVLEVVFTATGEIRVLRVARGLGYGLDENAITAANSIRFRPAKQNGRFVDSTAAIRMSFALAY